MDKLKRIEIFGIVFFISVTIFFYTVFISPQVNAFRALSKQYYSQKRLLIERRQKEDILPFLQNDNLRFSLDYQKISKLFVKKDEYIDFLNSLNSLVIQTGNKLESIRPLTKQSDNPSESKINVDLVELNFVANFSSLLNFLKSLEEQSKLLTIKTLQVNKRQEDNLLDIEILIEFYTLV